MLANEIKDETRRLLRDTEPDYLFSDPAIYLALSWAQDNAARRTEILSKEKTVAVKAGESTIKLPEYVLNPLAILEPGWLEPRPIVTRPSQTGTWGQQRGLLFRYAPVPSDMDVTYTFIALPRFEMSENNPIVDFPSQFHSSLAMGAAFRLMSTMDADAEDPKRLQELGSLWASELIEMRRYAAQHNRTFASVSYGGI